MAEATSTTTTADTKTADTTTATDTTKAADKSTETATILDTTSTDTATDTKTADAAAPDWATTRTKWARGNEKAAKLLERYASPEAFVDAHLALKQKMDSGELKPHVPFPEKGTDADKAAWRTAAGVPEKPEDYLAKLPEGIKVAEHDKERVTAFAAKMHAKHAPPELVHEAIGAYYEMQQKQIEAVAEQDKAWRQETEDALRAEWGNDYRSNVTRLGTYLDSMGELGAALKGARLADGRPLFAHPEAARYFMSVVNEFEPTVSLVPGAGGNQVQAIDDEIGTLRKMMGDKNSEYWKGANAEKNQARYRQLLAGKEKLAAKKAA